MTLLLPLLLASASPRRRQLIASLGLPYTVGVSPIAEDAVQATYDGPPEQPRNGLQNIKPQVH